LNAEELLDELYAGLLAIRSSLDLPYRLTRDRHSAEYQQALKLALLKLEAVRLDAMVLRRMRGEPPPLLEALPTLRAGFEGLLNDPEFLEVAGSMRFRASPGRDRLPSLYHDPDMRIGDAIAQFLRRMDELQFASLDGPTGIAALRRMVPEQKLAPAIFSIEDQKLVLVKQPARGDAEDYNNIERARDALVDRGKSILEALERSNCDRRVMESLRELQNGLAAQDNIIELGLLNLGVERICKGAAAELPDALIGAIEGHTTGVGMYVAQFPEWKRFSENAAAIDLTATDIERIGGAAQSVIDHLALQPEIADAEVPKTLKALRALIDDPKTASKRAAFAVLRTIENLVAKVYEYGADFLGKTATKISDKLSTATSHVVIGSLMALALAATANLGGVTGKVAEAAWMRTAAQIVKKQIEELAKSATTLPKGKPLS
jgi:hypothetical protein